jgi:RNA polymerase sigma-70 factor (ECF subfamily)
MNLHDNPETELVGLLASARAGGGDALGRLLERYRNYLALVIRLQLGSSLEGKLEVEDALQEVALAAHRAIGRFRGVTEAELLSWLRQIVGSVVSNLVRRFRGTLGRDLRREQPLEQAGDPDASSRAFQRALVAAGSSPSQQAARREAAVLLADALESLPSDYREVIILRQLEDLSFPEVARRMARSEDSVKNLWARALARLRRAMEDPR